MRRTYKEFLYTSKRMPRATAWRQQQKLRTREKLGMGKVLLLDEPEDVQPHTNPSEIKNPNHCETETQILKSAMTEVCNELQITEERNRSCSDHNNMEIIEDTESSSSLQESSDESEQFPSKFLEESLTKHNSALKVSQVNKLPEDICVDQSDDTNSSSSESLLEETEDDNSFTHYSSLVHESENENNEAADDIIVNQACGDFHCKADNVFDVLCPCNPTTAEDVMLMCLALSARHNLTWEAQLDIFKMFNTIYGRTVIRPTKYSYFKVLGTEAASGCVDFHVVCPECDTYLNKSSDYNVDVLKCPNCGTEVKISESSFASVAFEPQIKKILENPNLAELMVSHRFTRRKMNVNCLEDVFDGAVYKEHSKPNGILSSPFNFSYSFATDGVQFGKSSSRTLWPIYVTLQELPPEMRNQHCMLAGLYVGSKDPNHELFLKPFVDYCNRLSSEGFSWFYKGEEVISKCYPLMNIADSGARYQILNMQSYVGTFGCTFCYKKSSRTRKGQRFTITENEERPLKRTLSSTAEDLKISFQRQSNSDPSKRHYRGVKGPSALIFLNFFGLIIGSVVDYMHAILVGVVRTHMSLILESTRKKFWLGMNDAIGMEHLMSAIDDRLLRIKPPSSITRRPRSIKDYKLWKASEWRSWLLFYALPCLNGLLKEKHVSHIAMLSVAVNLLLQRSVHPNDVTTAHNLFMCYTSYCQKYFGEVQMLYNVHLLSHICEGVLNWGPLWTHNAFPYEGQNHYLLQLYKSSASIVKQITQKFIVYSSIPRLCLSLPSSMKYVDFCESILNKRLKNAMLSEDCVLLGIGDVCQLTSEQRNCLESHDIDVLKCLFYSRILMKRMRLTTFHYSENKKTCDAFVSLSCSKFVKIIAIIKMEKKVCLLVEQINVERKPLLRTNLVIVNYLRRIEGKGNLKVIQPHEIQCQCIVINLPLGSYITKMPFGCYGD